MQSSPLLSFPSWRTWRLGGSILFALFALIPNAIYAAGDEWSAAARDLKLTLDTRWAGGAYGGYYPLRVRLTNTGRARTLTVRYSNASMSRTDSPIVERRINIEQNATQQFTLSVPLVNSGNFGSFHVLENGRLLDDFTHHVTLSDPHQGGPDRPSLLVISPTNVDCDRFEDGINAANGMGLAASGSTAYSSSYGPSARTQDHQYVTPGLLPESWIDYSALDIVAVPFPTFERLSPAVRTAIIHWTETGGTLLLYDVGSPGADSKELSRLLGLNSRNSSSTGWIPANVSARREVTIVNDIPPASAMAGPAGGPVEEPAPLSAETSLPNANIGQWPPTFEAFSRHDLLLGRVFAFAGNPFPGAAIDWAWWLNNMEPKEWSWPARQGVSSRHGHNEFAHFLIPGVGSVPVFAFLTLITLFTVVIGPVNYWLLWRRRQLYLLVLTIPAIALLTSISLFSYALVADGFGVKSRLRSFTVIDQQSKTAVSFNRISIYAGLAPSSGLNFSPDTAVLPIWPDDEGLEVGRVDWTDTQHYAHGWVLSRTMAEFETINHRAERGRLEVKPAAAGAKQLSIANGLAWEIDTLVVKTDAGDLFYGQHIPAGASTQLRPARASDLSDFSNSLIELAPRLPDPSRGYWNNPLDDRARYRMGITPHYGNPTVVQFDNSLLEQNFKRVEHLQNEGAGESLPRRAYLASFKHNPGIELGIERTTPQAGSHLWLGYY